MRTRPHRSRGAIALSVFALRREIFWIALFSVVANVLTLAPTLYMLQVFDRVMISRSEVTLVALTLMLVLLAAAMAFAEWIRSRLLVRAGLRFDEELNTRVFKAGFRARLIHAQGGMAPAFGSLTRVRQFLTGTGLIALFDVPWTVIYLAVLFVMHPLLGWAGLVLMLMLAVVTVAIQRMTAVAERGALHAESSANGFLSVILRNAEAIHAMGMLNDVRRRWGTWYGSHARRHLDAQSRALKVQSLSRFLQYAQQSVILAIGAVLAIRGELSIGAMAASNLLLGNALRPMGILIGAWKELGNASEAARELGQLLAIPQAGEAMPAFPTAGGELELGQLVARSGPGGIEILKGIDLRLEPGELVGIVGPSGAGKSTLAQCMVGIWPHTEGSVRRDGIELTGWHRGTLGAQTGYLPQEIELLEGTVAENICRFAETEPEHVIAAAKLAGVHDMILRLPAGYDTPVGQAGKLLSAGQRQRLALARAVYKLPQLVVLDEPNANLDEAGEAALVNALRTLRDAGKTIAMIVHQKQLLGIADRVVVINEGRIVQVVRSAPAQVARAMPAVRP